MKMLKDAKGSLSVETERAGHYTDGWEAQQAHQSHLSQLVRTKMFCQGNGVNIRHQPLFAPLSCF